ncbi:MAG: hypothetical protein NVV57_08630 [Demequina sp.]|nr:hypothetical protein [Demequina sp.]
MSPRRRRARAAVTAPPLMAAVQAPRRRFGLRWRRSLMFRVVVTTLLIGFGTVALLSAYVNSQIRDGLVDKRVDRVLQQSAQDAATAQQDIDASAAENPNDLTDLVLDLVGKLNVLGGEDRVTVLLRTPDNTSGVFIQTQAPDQSYVDIISDDMRAAVESGTTQPWQFVELPDGTPGVVVGESLTSGRPARGSSTSSTRSRTSSRRSR